MNNAARDYSANVDVDAVVTANRDGEHASPFTRFRQAHVAATQPVWPAKVVSKMSALLRLRPDWDTYGAPSPRYDAAMFALTLLDGIMRPDTPEPSVVPTPNGGVQLEWHETHVDLEIHVLAPYEGDVWWKDHGTGVEHAVDLSQDITVLQQAIGRMSG